MNKNTKLLSIAAVVIALLLGAGWYFGSPKWTLYQMRTAAVEKDAKKLEGYVDFPSVRESIKSQVKAHMVREMEKEKDNPFAGLGIAIAMGMTDSLVEGLVTPSAMQAMFDSQPKTEDADKLSKIDASQLQITRSGLSEFELKDPNDASGANLFFRREGLGWKLVDIRVPMD